MIVDMRLRPPLPSWKSKPQFNEAAGYYPTRIGFPRSPSMKTQAMPDLIKEMDDAGITWGVIMGRQSAPPLGIIPNAEIAEAISRYPSRFIGFAGIDLGNIDAGIAEIESLAKEPGFRGVSIEPGASQTPMYSDDPRLYPIYERCQALELPVSISLSGFLSAVVGHDLAYGSPSSIYKAATQFPRLSFIVSHAAWPNVMPMIEVAFLKKNVYVSPDLYMNHVDMPGAGEFIKAARLFLGERLLFGTAYPSRPLKESVDAFVRWDLEPALLRNILYGNAARLLRLSADHED